MAEKIRDRIAEEFFDDISVPDQFFTNGTAVKMKFIPILKEILYNEGYFQRGELILDENIDIKLRGDGGRRSFCRKDLLNSLICRKRI